MSTTVAASDHETTRCDEGVMLKKLFKFNQKQNKAGIFFFFLTFVVTDDLHFNAL